MTDFKTSLVLALLLFLTTTVDSRSGSSSSKNTEYFPLLSSTSSTTSATNSSQVTTASSAVKTAIEDVKGIVEGVEELLEGGDFGGVAENNNEASYRSSDNPSVVKGREGDNESYARIPAFIPWLVVITLAIVVVASVYFIRWRRNHRLTRFGSMQYSSPSYLSGDENILL